jgi:branched-chain amino acid transport system ATP-binding protein
MEPRAMLLDVRNLEAGYGSSQVLLGLSFSVAEHQVVSLLGRNGMGKTTTIRAIMGMLAPSRGEIRFDGQSLAGVKPHQIAHLGIGLVPEGRHIFPNLTVRENLLMAEIRRAGVANPWNFERVLAFFPRLGERLNNGGSQLSGGEQQMLAIGRALMTNPRLLILDEATEGLAPVIRQDIWAHLRRLRQEGLALIVIDKEVDTLDGFVDRHFIVEKGEVVWSGSQEELQADSAIREKYLAV